MTHATAIDLLNAGDKGLPTAIPIEVLRYARLAGKVKELKPIYAEDRARVKRWLVNLGWRFASNGIESPGPFINRQNIRQEAKDDIKGGFERLLEKNGPPDFPTTDDERLTFACWISQRLVEWKVQGDL